MSIIQPFIDHFRKEPTATKKDIELFSNLLKDRIRAPSVIEFREDLKLAFAEKTKSAIEEYRFGIEAHESGRFHEAIRHFENALRIAQTPSLCRGS